jgi:RimJ/RimL family protein N-acetyltransferase
VVLTPLSTDEVDELRAIHATPEVAAWWGRPGDDFPDSDDPDATRFAIRADGEVVGLIQFGEESDPQYRHAWIDLFIDPRRHGQGLCPDAIVTLLAYLADERGHHRVTIDPAVDNAAAVRCYEKAGFRRVGVLQSAERDPLGDRWRDVLLMERVLSPGA